VEVSLNGADWTIWCTHFTFVQWELLALEPPNALPGAALKLRGANFAAAAGAPAEVRVRFQVTLADGEQIVVSARRAPPHTRGERICPTPSPL